MYDDDKAIKLRELATRTKPGDYFFQAAWLDLYFPLQLRNPSYVDALSSSSTSAQVEDVIKGLEQHRVRYVLWSARLDEDSTRSDVLQPVRRYLKEHYRVVERLAPAEDVGGKEPAGCRDVASRARTVKYNALFIAFAG